MPVNCVFLDVGQGSSSVLLVGNRRAIVIDCGRNARTIVDLLKRNSIVHIDRLILSHNDADHIGGAPELIKNFPKAIGEIYLLFDRPNDKVGLFSVIDEELKAGNLLNEPKPLCAVSKHEPYLLWENAAAKIKLRLIAPTFWDWRNAQKFKDPNSTSAIVVLNCAGRRVVFPGDSTIGQWEAIEQHHGRLACEIIAVPHHGGIIWRGKDGRSQVDWLYSNALNCKRAIISVGSSNNHGHPHDEVVEVLRSKGIAIMCTQITPKCCNDLEQIRPGLILPTIPSRASSKVSKTSSGVSCDVGCASTVVARITDAQVRVERRSEHQQAVDVLKTRPHGNPACRS